MNIRSCGYICLILHDHTESCGSESSTTELDSSQESGSSDRSGNSIPDIEYSDEENIIPDVQIGEHEEDSEPAPPTLQLTPHGISPAASPRKQRLKYKSTSLPRDDPPPQAAAQDDVAPPTGSTSTLHPSPASQRRKSVPPATPPGNSPAVSRKKLVFTQRPQSKCPCECFSFHCGFKKFQQMISAVCH